MVLNDVVASGASGTERVNVDYEERDAVIAAYPRDTDFANKMIDAFYDGMKHRPASTFGTFNDDFLAHKDPSFERVNLCSVILSSLWECSHG